MYVRIRLMRKKGMIEKRFFKRIFEDHQVQIPRMDWIEVCSYNIYDQIFNLII